MSGIDLLSLIDVPDEVRSLTTTQEGRELLIMFQEIDAHHPDFFGAIASMAGVGMPTKSTDGRASTQGENEGKRIFAIELLAVLKVAQESKFEET